MKKWRLAGGVALVFVFGVLAGASGFHLYEKHRSERFRKDPAERRAVFLQRLTQDLRLSEGQQKEFMVLVGQMDGNLEALKLESRTGFQRLADEGFARMKERLNPDQRQKLDEMRARHEARMRERRGRPPFL